VAERLLSDTRFVEQFIRQHVGRGRGPVRIRAELRNLAVSDTEVEAGLEAAAVDWAAVARDVRRRRFGVSPPGDYPSVQDRPASSNIAGFTNEQIRAALGPGEDIDDP